MVILVCVVGLALNFVSYFYWISAEAWKKFFGSADCNGWPSAVFRVKRSYIWSIDLLNGQYVCSQYTVQYSVHCNAQFTDWGQLVVLLSEQVFPMNSIIARMVIVLYVAKWDHITWYQIMSRATFNSYNLLCLDGSGSLAGGLASTTESIVSVASHLLLCWSSKRSVRWLYKRYIGREETIGKAICWRGLIFEASCTYSKISPLPSLLISGGLTFGRIQY